RSRADAGRPASPGSAVPVARRRSWRGYRGRQGLRALLPRAGSAARRAPLLRRRLPAPRAAAAAAGPRPPARWRGRAACRRGAGRGFRPSAPDDSVGSVSPKTLTGVELDLDDAPARESELFLVDGNNLAYRA